MQQMEGKGTPPLHFSWCEPENLAACGFPEKPEEIEFLMAGNVGCIVSLTAERDVEKGNISDDVLKIVKLPIKDYTPPTMEQVQEFIRTVQEFNAKGKAVCIHCAHGMGRTGTMLGCYYVKAKNMKPDQAIDYVRQLRPGSIETNEQEALVHSWAKFLGQKK